MSEAARPLGASGASTPVPLPFGEVARRLRALLDAADLGILDAVVAVARGGVVAGAMTVFHLRLPLRLLSLHFRDDDNEPLAAEPALVGEVPDVAGRRVLLVDDVGVTGSTLRAAERLLRAECVTLVVKGRSGVADHVVFDDVPSCVVWPWHEDVA